MEFFDFNLYLNIVEHYLVFDEKSFEKLNKINIFETAVNIRNSTQQQQTQPTAYDKHHTITINITSTR